MSSEQEAILRFGIEIEKMLCEKLGKQWRPSGMSIESLVEEMSAKANAPSAYVHLPNGRRTEMSEQKPVAWMQNLTDPQPKTVIDLRYCSFAEHEQGDHLKYIPVYTHPAPDVVAQLVEALEKITQVDAGSPVKTYQEMEDIAKAALEAAKQAGL